MRKLYVHAHHPESKRFMAIDADRSASAHNADAGFVYVDYYEKVGGQWVLVDRGNLLRECLLETQEMLE